MKNRKKRTKASGHSKEFIRKQKARQTAFLLAFKKTGRQNKACEESGVSADAVALWREADPEFDAEYLKANDRLRVILIDAAVERAVEGVEKGVYFMGERVGTEREYADGLLARLLAAHDKRFRSGVLSDAQGMPSKVVVINYGDSNDD